MELPKHNFSLLKRVEIDLFSEVSQIKFAIVAFHRTYKLSKNIDTARNHQLFFLFEPKFFSHLLQ